MHPLQASTVAVTLLLIAMSALMKVLVNRRSRGQPILKLPSSDVSLTKSNTSRPKIIRISRISKTISHGKLRKWLESLKSSSELPNAKNVIHLSVAPENADFSQATATLLDLPPQFQDLGENTHSCVLTEPSI